MKLHRFALPAVASVAMALSTVTVTAAPAVAADEFTCRSSTPVFNVLPNGQIWHRNHEEPETGANSWSAAQHVGNGWSASSYAGPGGKMYHVTAAGELRQHTWTSTGWADGGAAKTIRTTDSLKIYNTNPAFHKRFTVDSRGDFYLVDAAGTLRMLRYKETTGTWFEWILDNNWNQYDAIFAAGNGVLYGRTPAGVVHRSRYHADSQRFLSYRRQVADGWAPFSNLFSPGADITYGINGQNVQWYRYIESESRWAAGSGTVLTGNGWPSDTTAAITTPDSCSLAAEPNPAQPPVTVDRAARPTLLKTTNGYLQYGYVDPEGRGVHAEIQDVTAPNPNGFATIPGYASFTGAPTMSENENGLVRFYGHGSDSGAHGFAQVAGGGWSTQNDLNGRLLSTPQLVRTTNKLQTMLAFDANGVLWLRPQLSLNGALHAWRSPASATALSAGTREYTAFASGDSIVVIALQTSGKQCRTNITAGAQSAWQCSAATGFTGAAAAVPMPDGTVQLFARRSDGIYTARTAANGAIPNAWTLMEGTLPGGVTAVGAPSAVLTNGTLQVVTRGSDGYVYRSGQTASGSTAWTPWTEITNYARETAVDPTLSLAGNTWVVAFRTPAGEPQLWRFAASSPTARSASAGEFAEVQLRS